MFYFFQAFYDPIISKFKICDWISTNVIKVPETDKNLIFFFYDFFSVTGCQQKWWEGDPVTGCQQSWVGGGVSVMIYQQDKRNR